MGAIDFTALELVQGQLKAYNNHDIEDFCRFFSNDIQCFDARTQQVLIEGIDEFRQRYTQVFANPQLVCHLQNRIQMGNIIIDHELVEGRSAEPLQAIAIYHIENDKITKVHFYT